MNQSLTATTCDHEPLLESLISLLRELSEDKFRYDCSRLKSGSVGGHFRHCIEFYQCFLNGLEGASVDYDSRQRDLEIETRPAHAISALEEVMRRLSLTHGDRSPEYALRVREGGDAWLNSVYARESRFLASHTVHHMALISVLLRAQDVDVPVDFGVASSTLKARLAVSEAG